MILFILYKFKKILLIFSCIFFLSYTTHLLAGPPFITDDPETAEYQQLEVYPFLSVTSAHHLSWIQMPALELDEGFMQNAEIHLILNVANYLPNHGKKYSGLGDTEVNVKYRFLNETNYLPSIAIVPTLELPSGNNDRSLGNGRLWTKLPIWLEKNWGKWKTYGGGGYAFNSAPNMKTYLFGGWVLQRNINDQLSLGGEIYLQGATVNSTQFLPFQDSGHVMLLNFGGSYQFSSSLSTLFSLGHSVTGTNQWVGYLGLQWLISVG